MQDHISDVQVNGATFISLIIIGQVPMLWWFDAVMAMVTALKVFKNWTRTCIGAQIVRGGMYLDGCARVVIYFGKDLMSFTRDAWLCMQSKYICSPERSPKRRSRISWHSSQRGTTLFRPKSTLSCHITGARAGTC